MVHYSNCSALGFDEGFGSGLAFVDQLFELSVPETVIALEVVVSVSVALSFNEPPTILPSNDKV